MGYSTMQALDSTDPVDWCGQDIHLLGAGPTKQFTATQDLTRPTNTDAPLASIVGVASAKSTLSGRRAVWLDSHPTAERRPVVNYADDSVFVPSGSRLGVVERRSQ